MPLDYEELDYQETPLGALTLRRRRLRSLDNLEVYEIILGTGYLMSSLFTTVEIALADLAHVGMLVHQGQMERRPILAPQLPLLD